MKFSIKKVGIKNKNGIKKVGFGIKKVGFRVF